jgi:tripartite-type tricarboxylate transporter receptor subunit TctC
MAPGSAADIVARLLGPSLSEQLGQPVIIDNQPGVGGNLATETVVKAEADGSTLLMVGPSSAINATLYENLTFNFMRDITPVASVAQSPNVMVVNSALAVASVSDFVHLAKSKPGALKMASAGVGTATHLAGEMFQLMAGIEMVHLPYRGGGNDAYAGLRAGDVDVYFPPLASAIDDIKSGRLRALGVTTSDRDPRLPVPTIGESLHGYKSSTWFGIGAPRNTPVDVVERLNRAINTSLADPQVQTRLAQLGTTPQTGSPADFGRSIAKETQMWANVIPFAGISAS